MTWSRELTSATVHAIMRHYEATFVEDDRTYLGGSVIGDPCERKLWYGFRWAVPREEFDGRMLRLFQTGHREEARVIEDLRAIGYTVTGDAEHGQIAVSFARGHGGGHLDGVVSGVRDAPKKPHVLEVKTFNVSSFEQLVRHEVKEAKPTHYAQMQTYMHLTGHDRALYIAVCKNDDRMYAERVPYDAGAALALMAKAERIVSTDRAPIRISDNPESFSCRFCPARRVCHEQGAARRNCRTCLHATVCDDGRWYCERHDVDLSVEDQRAGCGAHLYLPSLVPGTQIDANPEAETVTYDMPDGSTWVDGADRDAS